jgi:ankyrin repeat protein
MSNVNSSESLVSHATTVDKDLAVRKLLEHELCAKLEHYHSRHGGPFAPYNVPYDPELVTDLDAILRRAAAGKNLDRITLALDAGANVNGVCPVTGKTALMEALDHYSRREDGIVACVEKLLTAGADVNIKDLSGWTPLMRAFKRGYETSAERLMDYCADLEARDGNGRTVLLQVCYNSDKIEQLLDRGADINAVDSLGDGVFHCAIQHYSGWNHDREQDRLELLLEAGADINHRDNEGRTPLYIAAANGHTKLVKTLLALGAIPWIPDNRGYLPVQVAVYQNTSRVIASRMREFLHFIEEYSREERMARMARNL